MALSFLDARVPNWLGQMQGCVVEAHSPKFDSYCWLNDLGYLVLVMVGTVSTLRLYIYIYMLMNLKI